MSDEATKPEEGGVPKEQAEEEPKFKDEDPRTAIYRKADELRRAKEQPAREEPPKEEPAGEQPTEPEKPADEPVVDAPEPSGEPESPQTPKTFTWDEIRESLGDIRIRDKVAGEEVELPIDAYRKAYGRGKDFEQRYSRLKSRERELDERMRGIPPTPDAQPVAVESQQIQEKYDELFAESPWKAQQYLASVREHQERQKAERAYRDIMDFRELNPEATDADLEAIDKPAFYEKYRDVMEAKERGDLFLAVSRAYTHLQKERIEQERLALKEEQRKSQEESRKKAELKKKGQVVRTSTKPPPPKKEEGYQGESRQDYVRRHMAEARKRMGLPT